VPIADKVLPFWQKFISDSQCGYVLNNTNGKPLKYDNFKRNYWTPLQNDLGFDHTIHETRHTCISMLVSANVNHTIIKKIVGHKSKMDLTEKVYTHVNPKELVNAINKI
jgi:integrase